MLVLDRRDVRHLRRPGRLLVARYVRVRGPNGVEQGTVRGRTDRHRRRRRRSRRSSPTSLQLPEPVRAADAARRARDLVRRRDVRALPRRTRRGERRQGRVHDGLRRAASRALHEGRRNAPNRRAGTADRHPRRLDLERPRARDRRRPRDERPHRGLHDRQRRLVARHRGREPALPPAGEDLRRRVLVRAGRLRPGRDRATRSSSRCASPTSGVASSSRARLLHRDDAPLVRRARRSGCSSTTPCRRGASCSPAPGLVPPDSFTLLPGHFVEIHVPEIGTLVNPVVRASELIEKEPDQ